MAYAVSDLVICRSGATTISEVTHLGLPVVFIPFPHAAEGHQEENARALQKEGAAELITEGELNTGRFEQVLNDLFCDPKRRKVMAGKAKKFGKPEAAQLIVKDILHCIR